MVSLEYARLMCEDCKETVQLIHPGVPFDKLEVCKCIQIKAEKAQKEKELLEKQEADRVLKEAEEAKAVLERKREAEELAIKEEELKAKKEAEKARIIEEEKALKLKQAAADTKTAPKKKYKRPSRSKEAIAQREQEKAG